MPPSRSQPEIRRVGVFCGSSFGRDTAYREAASSLGRHLAHRRIGLVYGGAHVGLMGVLADAALTAGGGVFGVIPRSMVEREIAHRGLTELHIVETMHERKAKIVDLSDALVALPGGYGTLDEFFEAVTWAQLGHHAKPCALLNVRGFFDTLLAHLDRTAAEGFLHKANRDLIVVERDAEALLDRLTSSRPVPADKWS